jgi:hypothetical protein
MCLQTSDDGSMNCTALLEWQTHVKEAATKTGVEWTNVPNYKRWMIEKGFEEVTEINFRWPSNQWSSIRKERLLGAWTQALIDNGMLESVSTRLFMMKLGWSKVKLDEFLARVNRDTKDPNIKAYSPMSVPSLLLAYIANAFAERSFMGESRGVLEPMRSRLYIFFWISDPLHMPGFGQSSFAYTA